MKYEVDKLIEMKAWIVRERTSKIWVLKGMFVNNVKEDVTGNTEYWSHWVACGDLQTKDEYNETFAPSGDYVSAKIIMAISSGEGWKLVTLDISSAYLYRPLLDVEIYMEYPTGFTVPRFVELVCKLKKTIYGLKQGSHDYFDHFCGKMLSKMFKNLVTAPSVYHRRDAEGETLMGTHIDDCTAACKSSGNKPEVETNCLRDDISLNFKFKEKDPSNESIILGMVVCVNKEEGTVKIHVGPKVTNLLKDYNMVNATPAQTPMVQDYFKRLDDDHSESPTVIPWPYKKLIGELQWIATVVHPNISFAVNVLARFLEKPKAIHWEAAKRILAYLIGTKELGILYRKEGDDVPITYSDSDWAGDHTDRKLVSGYVVILKGGPVQWKSRKQKVVAKSTAEAKYLAASTCAQESIWFRNFYEEIGRSFGKEPMVLHIDNQAALQMTKNPVYLSKTKHIDIPTHHIRDEVKSGRIKLKHIDGNHNPADILTKPLPAPGHERGVKLLGMT